MANKIHAQGAAKPELKRSRAPKPSTRLADVVVGDRIAIAEALDCLPLGVFVVDAGGKVIHMNESAKAITRADNGLRVVTGRLHACLAEDSLALRALLQRTARRGDLQGRGGAMPISRPGRDKPLSVIVTPLRHQPEAPSNGEPVGVLFVSDPENGQQTPDGHLMDLFGLTRSEAMLTLALLEGRGLDWAARHAGMSVNTARTHLKRVFEKTGTHRQAELVRLILSSPAILHYDERRFSS